MNKGHMPLVMCLLVWAVGETPEELIIKISRAPCCRVAGASGTKIGSNEIPLLFITLLGNCCTIVIYV